MKCYGLVRCNIDLMKLAEITEIHYWQHYVRLLYSHIQKSKVIWETHLELCYAVFGVLPAIPSYIRNV